MLPAILPLVIVAVLIPTLLAFVFLSRLRHTAIYNKGFTGNKRSRVAETSLWVVPIALISGAGAYLIIEYGGSIASFAPVQRTSRINLSIYDGKYKVPPNIVTQYPAHWETGILVEAPLQASVRSTYEIKLDVIQRGAGSLKYRKGTYIASLGGPPHATPRGIPPCQPSVLKELAVKANGGAKSCHTISSVSGNLSFRWLVDTSETGNLLHDLSVGRLFAFPTTTASIKSDDQRSVGGLFRFGTEPEVSSRNYDDELFRFGIMGAEIDTREPWTFILMRGDQIVRSTNPERIVRLGEIEVDLRAETILIPVEILTSLGLRESTQGWLQVIGAISAALLSAGAGAWIFGTRNVKGGS